MRNGNALFSPREVTCARVDETKSSSSKIDEPIVGGHTAVRRSIVRRSSFRSKRKFCFKHEILHPCADFPCVRSAPAPPPVPSPSAGVCQVPSRLKCAAFKSFQLRFSLRQAPRGSTVARHRGEKQYPTHSSFFFSDEHYLPLSSLTRQRKLRKPPAPPHTMSPKNSSFEPFAAGASSLPLLVQMPDGVRRQVDVSATASVRDLKDSIAANISSWSSGLPTASGAPPPPGPSDSLAGFDLDFAGSVLNDSNTLGDYHIPDVYDHASGLLRTISDSAHTDAGKKVEALDKACAVVAGISRGERDMERLISAVFDDENPVVDEAAQPTLRAMRRRGRSRIPSLNLAALPPVGATTGKASPRAPPTPSQLIRRLSSSRPDLYDPAAAARAGDAIPPAPGASGEIKRQSSWFTEAAAMGAPDASAGSHAVTGGPGEQTAGSGALKRGNTWFTDVISAFGNSVEKQKTGYDGEGSSEGEGDPNDDVGGSEDDQPAPKSEAEGWTGPGGKTEPVVDANAGKKDGASLESKKEEDKRTANDKAGETLNAAVSAAAAVAGGGSAAATSNANASSGTASAGAGHSANKNAAPATGTASQNENAADGTQMDNTGSGANSTSPSSSAPLPEQQVIGLNPEHTSPEDDIKLPKKRGRKRKNPHLSEEQRKLQRQAQNRESAKLSRIRRKNMTAEYEKRVNTLEGENENLRDTVTALTDRLEILQNLLTISVQKRPVTTGPLAQSILPPQATAQTLLQPGAAGMGRQTSMSQPQQLTNLNYENF